MVAAVGQQQRASRVSLRWRLPAWAVYFRTMAVFCLAWYGLASVIGNVLLLPSPGAVGEALYRSFSDGELFDNAAISLLRLLVSLLAAAAFAIPLGLAIGMSRTWERLLELPVEILRPIAGIAWIPLALLMFGIGHTLPIFIMVYTAFFPMLIGTAAGVRGVDKRLVNAARTMGVSGGALVRQVIVPAALPSIMTSARVAVAASWTAVVAAELVGAPSGLGYAIEYYRSMLDTPTVMAFILIIGLLGFLCDRVMRFLSTTLIPWAATEEAR
jgi:NitT/TauT family transport system permease protein/taurine transport system permease protein